MKDYIVNLIIGMAIAIIVVGFALLIAVGLHVVSPTILPTSTPSEPWYDKTPVKFPPNTTDWKRIYHKNQLDEDYCWINNDWYKCSPVFPTASVDGR